MSEGEQLLTKTRLNVMLDDLLSGEGKLRYTSRIPLILNEHAPVSYIIFCICVNSVSSDGENTGYPP